MCRKSDSLGTYYSKGVIHVGQTQHYGLNNKNVHLKNHSIIRRKRGRGVVRLIERYFCSVFVLK